MSIVSTNNRLLYVNGGSFTGVQTDDTLTGNGTSAYPLGVNESALNPSEAELYIQANSGELNEVSDVVQTNSANWNSVTGMSGAYVPLSANQCTIGYNNSAGSDSLAQGSFNNADGPQNFAQGHNNSAHGHSLAQGIKNFAGNDGFSQGEFNYAQEYAFSQGDGNTSKNQSFTQGAFNSAVRTSFAQGHVNYASANSLAQGGFNYAYINSFAQGDGNSAENYSIAQGNFNTAFHYSQAFGNRTRAIDNGMAIGVCNNITSAAFVIGNGTSDTARSDCFVITHDGNVSACGDIQSSGISLLSLYNAFTANSGTWNSVTNKLDTTAFSDVSGSFLTAVNIPESATWSDVSDVVQTNSAQWAEGVISSYTTAYSHDIPPYGGEVINSLNGKYLSAYVSLSADNAKVATNANTATYAQTVDETKLVNDGFVKNLTSEYGTISVVRNTIESTNSAISRIGNEGFVSSYNDMESIGPAYTATYSWDKSLPNTEITLDMDWNNGHTLTYSANTELTGEVVLPVGTSTQTISIPNATEFKVWANDWVSIQKAVVSAADTFETVVGELAWASALPTYQYDEQDRISAINNSAIAAGDEFPASADEAIQYVQSNSGTIDDTVTSYQTNSGDYLKESELGYNAVDEVSAINGSAIAQYGAEKQWLVHDDTLVHASNSAQYALGVNLSAVAQLLGVDETVLFSSTSGGALSGSFTEELTNFNYIEFFCNRVNTTANSNLAGSLKIAMVGTGIPDEIMLQAGLHTNSTSMFDTREYFNLTNTGFTWAAGYNANITKTGTTGTNIISLDFKNFGITKVIGIGRKEV